jgi:hypothetical protein
MQAHATSRRDGSMILLGGIVVIVGLVALILEQTSIDVATWLGGSGWTLFVIVPGLVLLAAAIVLRDGAAMAATVGGAVVTTIGLLLLYQDLNEHYESWAYAWALIPMSAGLGIAVNGLRFARRDLVTLGTRMIAGFGLALLFGAWFFETTFETNQAPFNLGDNWPIALIVLGGVVLVFGLLRGSTGGTDEQA